jgi:tetratricopeptide (TPR) repeat protein
LSEQLTRLDAQAKELETKPGYHYGRGLTALQNKDYPGAIEAFEKSVSLAPVPPYTLNLGIAHQNYAVSLDGKDNAEAENQYKQAMKIFEKAEARIQLADSIEGLVILYLRDKRFVDAESYSKRLVVMRDQQKNLLAYGKAQKLYAEDMKALHKPIEYGPVPPGYVAEQAAQKLKSSFAEYDRSLKLVIHKKWLDLEKKYPIDVPTVSSKPLQGVKVLVNIGPNGSLKSSKLISVEHNEILDKRAVEAVVSAFPYQPLPGSAKSEHTLEVWISVRGVL